MHAVAVRVHIKSGRHDEAVRGLREEVVVDVKAAPGFVHGTWAGDAAAGLGLMVFESEAYARQMADSLSEDDDERAPVRIEDVQVFEVMAEA